ncbi:MAG: patatin-like phospholipase family protein, partial [Ktedonobacterales bacterium]|nr:patatin-like phospholipase family protein [Ktedonobacterales bacterium]
CNIVLSGGGVRGIAHAGALSVLEQRYQPIYVAGTSAGSIVGALYAAGFTAAELRQEMTQQDFAAFLEETPLEHLLPLAGDAMQLLLHLGVYRTNRLHAYVAGLLAQKNVTTFGDLKIQQGSPEYRALPAAIRAEIDEGNPRYTYRLHIIATDLTDNSMLILPDDVAKTFGERPDDFPIALAVQMSASIPGFFEPVRHPPRPANQQRLIVDGGLLSGYPLFLFDQDDPPWPTFGLHLVDGSPDPKRILPEIQFHPIHSPVDFALNLFQTLLNGRDNQYIATADFARSIMIPCAVKAETFALTAANKADLYQSGIAAATDLFGPHWEKWNFAHYQHAFGARQPKRRDLVVERMRQTASPEPAPVTAPAPSPKKRKQP